MEDRKFVIPVEAEDWFRAYMEKEPDLRSLEAAIEYHQTTGAGPQEMGRLLAIAKALEQAWDGVAEAKPMLNAGYAEDWSKDLRRQHVSVELENGTKIEVNSLVGPVQDGDGGTSDDDPAYVDLEDSRAAGRATAYIVSVIPGHVYSRLKVIAACGGDVASVAEDLHSAVDELVARLI